MTKIDRYILTKFLFNFVLWLVCLTGVVVVFDLFSNMDVLIHAGRAAGNVPKILVMFYFFKIVPMVNVVSSLLGLVAAMVSIAMMMRNNELVPLLAAGISLPRIIRPLIFASIVVTLIAFGLREMLLPCYIHKMTDNPNEFVVDQGKRMNTTIDNSTGITLQGDQVFRDGNRISSPSFVLPPPLVPRTIHLKAAEASYIAAQNGHPAGFILFGVEEGNALLKEETLSLDGKPVIITPKSAPDWLKQGECFVACDIPFMYFASNKMWGQYASTWELFQTARNGSLTGSDKIRARIHSRLVMPFLDMTLLFLGLPVVLVQGDRNVFKAMGISALLVMAFLVVKETCLFIGETNEMPVLGAWLPLMVFTPIAVNLCYGMSK